MPASRTTLAEIARRAGVHQSTVSRALSSSSTGVGAERTRRIRAIAEELGYAPNPAAAALRTGRSRLIGVLVPDLTDLVLASIYGGVDAGAHEAGLSTFVSDTRDDPRLRRQKLLEFQSRRVEGIVLGDARLDGDELVATLQRQGVPFVLVNRRLAGHPSVTTDDIAGGALAAAHLLERGHRELAVIAGPSYASTCAERTHGFVQQCRRAGIDVPEHRVLDSGADADAGYRAAASILERSPEVTAIFAINDFAAIGAMGAIRDSGRRPGTDVAVVGFNDVPLARHLPVPLTSVRSSMFEMGRMGAALLVDLLEERGVESIVLEPELLVRASSSGGGA